ncbi:MAG: hypothetical protein A2487_02130 [Candidatus Raymondbacteria bacterium RifOxyC12_full_50_8]|uniref:Putative zinc-finger domain-containing protein n=1 Tax=Candidatus Raymondbacteria bacterium RIFOXYD12_FULL_49_13 TaxID=1817890 RepID=A0A1F7FHE7_UNCRA|nr:MAG: hypothetical protein A2248_00840 [Candidatus Raymondbacteria bacterium RIFOXYA2_FULL_49_16]OGJ95874.1 MAG: hypothetical protein A2350_13390 [Candidatus Raymondbacteria bacterium RifOxyB12_full_50_8]OGK04877.1 MAG: hypothetical protein A2487_02130 [Candidatus Raymondbacteria bacterium RifOxyC12_full_50_8]OGK06018.1 MAG: hypothetical protein A2519_14710 [Candidatus Raymondbacteria bacterium RIFOXYD12_FULL_49_13]OGP42252.1 MAG: hypothetical protein A2324_01385 [Candidatus Raymondbacteria b
MKQCEQFRIMISRDIDGDLSPSEMALLQEHLVLCPECWNIHEQYLRLRSLLRSQPTAYEPAFYRANVPRSFWRMGWKIAAMLAICFGLFGTILLTRNESGEAQVINIVDKTLSPVMNMPIGALAYYRHFAGQVVQTQFSSISATTLPSMQFSLSDSVLYFYRSPLFQDTGFWDQHYALLQEKEEQ